jgi:hypothetical protein
MNVPHICPRCADSWIPDNHHPAEYPGAISRSDNKTEICSACGVEEAMINFAGTACEPVDQWPVRNKVN